MIMGVASNNITYIPNFTKISPVINNMKHTDMTRPTYISSMCCVKTYKIMMMMMMLMVIIIIIIILYYSWASTTATRPITETAQEHKENKKYKQHIKEVINNHNYEQHQK
jgi:uncharacterized membrane protein